jgi:pterin-4a-carbinolamine dehydratase
MEADGSPLNIMEAREHHPEVEVPDGSPPTSPLNIMEAREHHPEVEVPDGSPSVQATEYCGSP